MSTYHHLHTPELLDAYITRISNLILDLLKTMENRIQSRDHGNDFILLCQSINMYQREYRAALEEKDRRADNANEVK